MVTVDPNLLADPDPAWDSTACIREKIRMIFTDCQAPWLMGGWFRLPWWQPRKIAGIAQRISGSMGIDPTAGWITSAIRACEHLRSGQIDVVLASAPPYTAFEAAAAVARRLSAPLVLDYRDLWSQNPHHKKYAVDKIQVREAALLASAKGITVVSPSMARCLSGSFKLAQSPLVLNNGFDTEEYSDIAPLKFDGFAVVYAGRFYPPSRTAEPLIAAVAAANQLNSTGQPIRLHYFGSNQSHVENLAAKLGATQWVINHGRTSRRQVLSALKGANVAAVITTIQTTATMAEQGIITGKLFEALGARVPVLLISPVGSDASQLVVEGQLGSAFTGSDVEGMSNWLRKMCDGKPGYGSNPDSMFSWSVISEKLDLLLRKIVSSSETAVAKVR